jgi:hypothetical protein
MAEVGLLPNFLPGDLRWKYWQERTGWWPGPRSFVLARDNEILAHAAVVPGTYYWNDQRVRTVHVIDWVARPTAVGAGVSLMKFLGQAGDALLAIGGSAQTLQLLPHLGFRIRGSATGYVRALHPTAVLAPSVHPTWRVPPRFLRNVWWNLRAPRGGTDGWHVSRVNADELSRVASILPRPMTGMAVLERSEELFRYSLDCPIAAMSLFAMEREGRTRGYFLLTLALRQARLADCWMDSSDPADWRALIQCAVREARRYPDAAELAVWASDPMLSRCLRECGFHARNEVPVQLLGPRDPALLPPALRVQMLDNDAAYWHHGRNEFWA